MLFGRSNELKQLNHYYDREGSQIVVVYGQKNIGKTALIKEFAEDKPVSFYQARSCSEREQQFRWGNELSADGIKVLKYPTYEEILTAITADTISNDKAEKKIIVVDEFQNMLKSDSTFMKELVSFMHNQWNKQQFLFILSSSSVGFIENSMIHRIGDAAYELSGLLKLKELKYKDCMDFFPGFSKQQCMETYAILGGMPGLWMGFNDKLSIKENVIRYILNPTSFLYGEAERYVTDELRETCVYNTILASIADGKHKLNDLYLHTGFSRAKISVYLKNLMELEIVEKVFSYDTEGHANVQKGIYRIANRYVHFYYKMIYPHLCKLQTETPSSFYLSNISNSLKSYVAEYFKYVCMEYLNDRNERNLLPFVYDRFGEWIGKDGTIDIILQDEDANTLIALCNYDKPMMTYDDYEKLLFCADKARLAANNIVLFSIDRFDEKLELEAKVKKNLALISMKNM